MNKKIFDGNIETFDSLLDCIKNLEIDVNKFEEETLFSLLDKYGISDINTVMEFVKNGRLIVDDYIPLNVTNYHDGYTIILDNEIILQVYFTINYDLSDTNIYKYSCTVNCVVIFDAIVNKKEE